MPTSNRARAKREQRRVKNKKNFFQKIQRIFNRGLQGGINPPLAFGGFELIRAQKLRLRNKSTQNKMRSIFPCVEGQISIT